MNWMPRYGWNRPVTLVLACLICLVVPLAQFYFHRFDDNPFTGWHLIFLTTPHLNLLFVLICSMLFAWAALRISFPFPRAFCLFLACFFAAAFFWSVPEINTVAARYVTQAKYLELYGISYFIQRMGTWNPGLDGPACHTILRRADLQSFRVVPGLYSAFHHLPFRDYRSGSLYPGSGKSSGTLIPVFMEAYCSSGYPISHHPGRRSTLLDIHTTFFLTLSIYLFILAVEAGGIGRAIAVACSIFIAFFWNIPYGPCCLFCRLYRPSIISGTTGLFFQISPSPQPSPTRAEGEKSAMPHPGMSGKRPSGCFCFRSC